MPADCPLTAIGVVRSPRVRTENTPVQAALNRDEEATLEVFPPFVDGLLGLDGFDYVWLVTWLDRAPDRHRLRLVPYLLRSVGRTMGLFATRSPNRVNPLGLSLVRVLGVDGAVIRFAGVDIVDGTPVVDIKPYVSRFDRPEGEPRCGWFDSVPTPDGVTPADLGPAAGHHPVVGTD